MKKIILDGLIINWLGETGHLLFDPSTVAENGIFVGNLLRVNKDSTLKLDGQAFGKANFDVEVKIANQNSESSFASFN